jgi:hypothetical protein
VVRRFRLQHPVVKPRVRVQKAPGGEPPHGVDHAVEGGFPFHEAGQGQGLLQPGQVGHEGLSPHRLRPFRHALQAGVGEEEPGPRPVEGGNEGPGKRAPGPGDEKGLSFQHGLILRG